MNNLKEKWKPIEGFTDTEVSNYGKVRRYLSTGKYFYYKTSNEHHGHVVVQIKENGIPNGLRVSRLVGAAFCKDYAKHLRPEFLDGNKTNCISTNLKWITPSQVALKQIAAKALRARE